MSKALKFVVAAVGALGVVLAQLLQAGNVIPDKYATYATLALSVLTALGVYRVPNKAPVSADSFDDGGKDAGLTSVEVMVGVLLLLAVLFLAGVLH